MCVGSLDPVLCTDDGNLRDVLIIVAIQIKLLLGFLGVLEGLIGT